MNDQVRGLGFVEEALDDDDVRGRQISQLAVTLGQIGHDLIGGGFGHAVDVQEQSTGIRGVAARQGFQ